MPYFKSILDSRPSFIKRIFLGHISLPNKRTFSFSKVSLTKKLTMGGEGEKLSRKMIFPYTFTAKIAQFPYKLHLQHHWMYPWFIGASVLALPIFYKIQKAANCEANVKLWADKRRKEEEHHRHKWD